MPDPTSLQRVSRSMELGALADDVLAALEPSGSQAPQRSHVLQQALEMLRAAQAGHDIVELQVTPLDGISMAVDNAYRYRSAQSALLSIPARPQRASPEEITSAIQRLIGSVEAISAGTKVSRSEMTFMVQFFDALAEATLGESGQTLQAYAGQRYKEP